MTESYQNVIAALERDRVQNALLIRALSMTPWTERHIIGDSVAVLEGRSGFWMLSLAKPGDLARLVVRFRHPIGYTFMVTDVAWREEICDMFPRSAMSEYTQYVIDKPCFSETIYTARSDRVRLQRIGSDWLEYILSVYASHEFAHEDYLGFCLRVNPAWGATLDGEKVGFIMSHLDGELGTIAVSPKAQGQGIGRLLMQAITPDYFRQCHVGAGMVLPNNTVCARMLSGSNYVAAPNNVLWVYRDRESMVWRPEDHFNGGY